MSDSAPPPLNYFVEISGQRFGPANLELLRQWVREGRITPDSILIEEVSQARVPAREVPGLFEPGQVSPPPMAGMGVPPGYAPPKRPFPLWAILLVVVGGLCLLCIPVGAAVLFPVFSQAKRAAQRTMALSDMKQLGLAALMYANDFDDHFPLRMDSALDAKPALAPYARQASIFASVNPAGGSILGNGKLSGQKADDVRDPATTVMFYDEKPWEEKGLACFVDGSARLDPSFNAMVSSLQKDPIDHSGGKGRSSQ